MIKVIIGCGTLTFDTWIPTDTSLLDVLDKSTLSRWFQENSVDYFVAEHIWEHLTLNEGHTAFKNIIDFLKPGGHIRIAVPDGLNPDHEYIDATKPGGKGAGAYEHKVLYTYKILSELAISAGYILHLREYYDEDGLFHFSSWFFSEGPITRSYYNDLRNSSKNIGYSSLIVDCAKPRK